MNIPPKLAVAASLLLPLITATRAHAQAAPPAPVSAAEARAQAVRDAAIIEGRIPDPSTNSTRSYRGMMKSRSNQHPGFRNPGGVGRRAEYYPAGDKFQNESKPAVAATFDGNHNRDQQTKAREVGIEQAQSLQAHIDNYGRPLAWYGQGFGFGPGYGYPGLR